MKTKTFEITEKYLRSSLMLFPIFAYTKNFLEGSILSIWISLIIILSAIIINQITLNSYKEHLLGIYMLIIASFTSLTYLFTYYLTPGIYEDLKFSFPILIALIISFHKNEPFKNLKNPKLIFEYSKTPLLVFVLFSFLISFLREITDTGSLKFFEAKLIIFKDLSSLEKPVYGSNIFLLASIVFLLVNTLLKIKGGKND